MKCIIGKRFNALGNRDLDAIWTEKYTRKILSKCKQLFALEPNSRPKPHIFTSPIYTPGHQSASCDNPLSHTPAKNTRDPPCNAKRKRSPLIRGEKSHVALCVTRFIAMIECWLLMAVLGSPSLMFLFAWNALISCPLFKIICFFLLFLLFSSLAQRDIAVTNSALKIWILRLRWCWYP